MKRSFMRFSIISIFSISLMVLFVPVVSAQNLVDLVPNQPEHSDIEEDILSDEAIAKLLSEEGIPLTSTSFGRSSSPEKESTYTLGPKDVIEITVLRHPEVSGQFVINNEGNIQYNFVGDIEISGMKKAEVVDKLAELLGKYIISPEVTVKIVGYNSKVVYVVGEVGSPGKIFMQGDTITVREALIQASLPRLTAKATKSKLITPSADGKPKITNVNVYDLLYKGDLRQNLVMKPGDTLFIPPTIMAKAMRAFQPVTGAIGAGKGLGTTVTTGF